MKVRVDFYSAPQRIIDRVTDVNIDYRIGADEDTKLALKITTEKSSHVFLFDYIISYELLELDK